MSIGINQCFPYLLPIDNTFTEYKGYIHINGKQHAVEISLPKDKSNIDDCKFNCSSELFDLLNHSNSINTIKNRLVQCQNIQSFLVEFKDLLDRLSTKRNDVGSGTSDLKILPFDVYSLVLQEIDVIGWERVTRIDKSLCQLDLLLRDRKKRSLSLTINIPSNYPVACPIVQCLLPCKIVPPMVDGETTYSLPIIIEYIERIIEDHQTFFDVMDEIDSIVWVLEPERPNRSSLSRRIALGNSCSLIIDVNPLTPRQFPVYRLLGPERSILPLRTSINQNLNKWNTQDGLISNFERLNIKFPSKSNSKAEDYIVECGACYSHRLLIPSSSSSSSSSSTNNKSNNTTEVEGEGYIPDTVCSNIQCSKHFHRTCLVKWFQQLSKPTSFNTIIGECPYCSKPLSVPIN